ncbi:MAG: hypothetical protein R3293_27550 [Candidatus Promineifilaceae bacterium]|nr:hypothetical protein [Candidatus Promineifilaceae bacterium]
MATISPYIAQNLVSGADLQLRVKKFIWLTVGHGLIASVSDYEIAVQGKIRFLGFKGELDVLIRLLDQSPGSQSGPCLMELNILRDEYATYEAQNGQLIINAVLGGEKQRVALSQYDQGQMTRCRLSGYYNETAYFRSF